MSKFMNHTLKRFIIDVAIDEIRILGYIVWVLFKSKGKLCIQKADITNITLYRILDLWTGHVQFKIKDSNVLFGTKKETTKNPHYYITMLNPPNEFGYHTSMLAKCSDDLQMANLFIEIALRGDLKRINPIHFLQDKKDLSGMDAKVFEDTIMDLVGSTRKDAMQKSRRSVREVQEISKKLSEVNQINLNRMTNKPNTITQDSQPESVRFEGAILPIDEENKEIIHGGVAETRSDLQQLFDARDFVVSLIMNEPAEMIKSASSNRSTDPEIMKTTQITGVKEDRDIFVKIITDIYKQIIDPINEDKLEEVETKLPSYGKQAADKANGEGNEDTQDKKRKAPSESKEADKDMKKHKQKQKSAGSNKLYSDEFLDITFNIAPNIEQEVMEMFLDRHIISLENYAKLSFELHGLDPKFISIDEECVKKDKELLYQPLSLEKKGLMGSAGAGGAKKPAGKKPAKSTASKPAAKK